MDVLTVVEERVRAGVRSRGIDPQVTPDDVRQLVDDAVASAVGVGDVRPGDAVAVGTARTARGRHTRSAPCPQVAE